MDVAEAGVERGDALLEVESDIVCGDLHEIGVYLLQILVHFAVDFFHFGGLGGIACDKAFNGSMQT